MEQELAYSFHLGSDKNKSKVAKRTAKGNVSGTTSLSNNAIQNANDLSRVNKHNLRDYDNQRELITTIYGTNDIVEDVKQVYIDEFEESRIEFNNKQTRNDRKINNYFEKACTLQNDIACEIIIELGDMDFWQNKDDEYRFKMIDVYNEQIQDLNKIVPNFKVANATIHFDETSPHMHVVGIPVIDNCKKGMKKQVGKSKVFTKESLTVIQDKMRNACIKSYNKFYGVDSRLKTKQKGRNKDIHISDIDNYIQMKKQIEKNNENLKQANKKSSELKQNSKDIKDKIDKLKISKLNKDNYILSKEDKDSFINFIEQVDNTSKEYDKIQTLSNALVNAHNQLKDKNNKIKTLTENNETLNLRVKTLNDIIKEKDNEISFLKSKINDLKNTIEYWKDKFEKLISFLHDKLHSWYDKDDKYIDVVNDMYEDNVLDDDDIEELDLNKEKDDFER